MIFITRHSTPLSVIVLVLFHAPSLADDTADFRVPDGFNVSLYAGDELAHDIYSMTLSARLQIVVAGRGHIKTLHDDDDGRAGRATLFSNEPVTGARGMFFDGNDLICTGDDALARYRDANGDGVADGPREVLAEGELCEQVARVHPRLAASFGETGLRVRRTGSHSRTQGTGRHGYRHSSAFAVLDWQRFGNAGLAVGRS